MTTDVPIDDPALKNLWDELSQEDLRWVIVRMHLYIEQELARIVRQLPNPQALGDNFRFVHLARIAAATGLIHDDIFPALLELNTLRNHIAHNLDDVPDAKVQRFMDACPSYYLANQPDFRADWGKARWLVGQLVLSVRNTRSIPR